MCTEKVDFKKKGTLVVRKKVSFFRSSREEKNTLTSNLCVCVRTEMSATVRAFVRDGTVFWVFTHGRFFNQKHMYRENKKNERKGKTNRRERQTKKDVAAG